MAEPVGAESSDAEGWFVVQGPHIELYTNADPRVGHQIVMDLERFRSLFARLAPSLELRSSAPLRCVAFRDQRSYAPYQTRRAPGGTLILGQFVRHSDANYLLLDAGTRLREAYSVAFHELTHFLVTTNLPSAPLWLNEGLAEYYGTFQVVEPVDGEALAVVGAPIRRHVRWLLDEGVHDLESLLQVDGRRAAEHGAHEVGNFYALSWLLTHHLLSGDAERLDRTAEYLLRLRDGEDAEEAFERAFDRSLWQMEQDLQVKAERGAFPAATMPASSLGVAAGAVRVRRAPAADVLAVLGDFALIVGADEVAERHYQAALDQEARHAASLAGLATIRGLHGRVPEAEVLWHDARDLGMADPVSWLRLGRHALALAEERHRAALDEGWSAQPDTESTDPVVAAFDRARTALHRALDLEPDYAVAQTLAARAHLLPGGDPERGLGAVVRARLLLPEDVDLVRLEILLRLQMAQFGRARDLVEDDLATLAAPEDAGLLVTEMGAAVDVAVLVHDARRALDEGRTDAGLELLDRAVSTALDPRRRAELEAELLRLQRARESHDGIR